MSGNLRMKKVKGRKLMNMRSLRRYLGGGRAHVRSTSCRMVLRNSAAANHSVHGFYIRSKISLKYALSAGLRVYEVKMTSEITAYLVMQT